MRPCPPSEQALERVMNKGSLEKKEERQILIFTVASEELGLDIACVREVLRPQKAYPIPQTPAFY